MLTEEEKMRELVKKMMATGVLSETLEKRLNLDGKQNKTPKSGKRKRKWNPRKEQVNVV